MMTAITTELLSKDNTVLAIFHMEMEYILDKLLQVEVWHTDYQFVKHHTVLQVLRAIAYWIV